MKNEKTARKYYTVIEACEELHVSRNTLMRLALDAGSIVRIGSRNIRINMIKLNEYLENVNTVTQ